MPRILPLLLCLGVGLDLHAQLKTGSLQFDFREPPKPKPRKLEGTLPIAFASTRTQLGLPDGTTAPAEVVYVLPTGNRAGSTCQLRFQLTSTLGEPVWKFETRFPCFDALRLHPRDQGEALRYELDEDLKGERARRQGPKTIRVSRELMSLLRIARCRLALDLPLGSTQTAHIERDLPGQGGLGKPEAWGWDTPGSPEWSRVFLRYPFALRANKVPQADDHLPAAEARRLWAALQEKHGGGLVGAFASIQTFELDAGEFLRRTERCLAEAQMGELRFGKPGKPQDPDSVKPAPGLSEGLKGW